MIEEIYKRVAENHGKSVEEIKQKIQEAIEGAYKNPNAAAQKVPRKSEVPTVQELFEYLEEAVLEQLSKND